MVKTFVAVEIRLFGRMLRIFYTEIKINAEISRNVVLSLTKTISKRHKMYGAYMSTVRWDREISVMWGTHIKANYGWGRELRKTEKELCRKLKQLGNK